MKRAPLALKLKRPTEEGLSARLSKPMKIERDLMVIIPRKDWTIFAHRMIYHGRQVCHARRPLCEQCSLARVCPRLGL